MGLLKRVSVRVSTTTLSLSLLCLTHIRLVTSQSAVMDPVYPGTAVERRRNIVSRVKNLTEADLSQDWEVVRQKLLWAGGLRDLPNAVPGRGYTGHSFNDYNHCDLTAMNGEDVHNENEGRVDGIAFGNKLGDGIKIASLEDLGPGGSWSTCMMGCHKEPPQDVAHIQFRARIAFKLVWVPPAFTSFVLVGDEGELLGRGFPKGELPGLWDRSANFKLVSGSKYATAALSVSGVKSDTDTQEL